MEKGRNDKKNLFWRGKDIYFFRMSPYPLMKQITGKTGRPIGTHDATSSLVSSTWINKTLDLGFR
jgi:hypothetical protein